MSTFDINDPNLPHDSRKDQIIAICSAMLVLMTLVVAARFWIRLSLTKGQLGSDDWCIFVAWIFAAAFDLDPLNQVKYGLGQHIYDLPPDTNFSASLELYYFGEIIYYVCVAVTKIAVLLLYLRIAASKTLRTLIWTMMVFAVLSALSCVMASIFQCNPIRKAWDTTGMVEGKCIHVNALFYANAGLDIFQDCIIYVLPMRMLYQIQIPTRQKIALMFVFAIGGFVVITGMVRIYYLKGAQASTDPSYDNVGGAIWSSIECNIGVVCASLPHFKPVFDRYLPSLMGRTSRFKNMSDGSSPNPDRRLGTNNGYARHHSSNDSGNNHELTNGSRNRTWKDTYDGSNEHITNVDIEGGVRGVGNADVFSEGEGKEVMRDEVDGRAGIFKSTRVVVSHYPPNSSGSTHENEVYSG